MRSDRTERVGDGIEIQISIAIYTRHADTVYMVAAFDRRERNRLAIEP